MKRETGPRRTALLTDALWYKARRGGLPRIVITLAELAECRPGPTGRPLCELEGIR